MVKFLASREGRLILGLGLVRGNISRLMNGNPIHIDCQQLGTPELRVHEILIFYGDNELEIASRFRVMGFLTDDAQIKSDPLDRDTRKPS